MGRNYGAIIFDTLILRSPGVINFAGIINIAMIFIKTTFYGSKDIKIAGLPWKIADASGNQGLCHVI